MSIACLCPKSTSYPSILVYMSFHRYFFLSYVVSDLFDVYFFRIFPSSLRTRSASASLVAQLRIS